VDNKNKNNYEANLDKNHKKLKILNAIIKFLINYQIKKIQNYKNMSK